MPWFPLPPAGGAARLTNLFVSRSGVGHCAVAAHPRPLPPTAGEKKRPLIGRNQTSPIFVIPDLIRNPFSQRSANGPRIKSRVTILLASLIGRFQSSPIIPPRPPA